MVLLQSGSTARRRENSELSIEVRRPLPMSISQFIKEYSIETNRGQETSPTFSVPRLRAWVEFFLFPCGKAPHPSPIGIGATFSRWEKEFCSPFSSGRKELEDRGGKCLSKNCLCLFLIYALFSSILFCLNLRAILQE